jgi:hypothetical protein
MLHHINHLLWLLDHYRTSVREVYTWSRRPHQPSSHVIELDLASSDHLAGLGDRSFPTPRFAVLLEFFMSQNEPTVTLALNSGHSDTALVAGILIAVVHAVEISALGVTASMALSPVVIAQ